MSTLFKGRSLQTKTEGEAINKSIDSIVEILQQFHVPVTQAHTLAQKLQDTYHTRGTLKGTLANHGVDAPDGLLNLLLVVH